MVPQHRSHLRELRENQRLVTCCQRLCQHLLQASQLTRAARQTTAITHELGGMVTYLLKSQERRQYQPLALDTLLRLLDLLDHLLHHRLVKRGLFLGQVAEDLHLHLVGQVLNNRLIRFQTAQDEGLYQAFERFRSAGIMVLLNGNAKLLTKVCTGSQIVWIQKIHDRP